MRIATVFAGIAAVALVMGLAVEVTLPGGLCAQLASAAQLAGIAHAPSTDSAAPPSEGASVASEPHTCPMVEHAHVRSDGPGPCPLCGMDLVPISKTKHKGQPSAGTPVKPEPPAQPQPPAQREAPKGPGSAAESPRGPIYYCPMDPGIVSDRPGDCPKCNMRLVLLKGARAGGAGSGGAASGGTGSGLEGHAEVSLAPEMIQRIGVRTGLVEKRKVSRTVRASGRVDYDERGLSAVSLKFGGWIEELLVNATGQAVKKGDPLFVVYSPDLLEAQRNYLAALRASRSSADATRAFADATLASARERLLLWDVAPGQIEAIEARGEPETRVKISSRFDGVVTRRAVTQGTYAEPMKDLFELADLSRVWVLADVYEHELAGIAAGLDATVRLPAFPGESLPAKVTYVYPYLNEETRTCRVRLEIENPDGRLKPGMYGEVAIHVDLGERVVVDDQAVLDSGTRQIVFVDRGEGRLDPREVKVGARADGLAVILEGLMEGEKIVTSGNFLVDSESRLKAALLERVGR